MVRTRTRTHAQAGHALLVSMIGLSVLTIGAMGSVSIANYSLAQTSSFHSQKAFQYAATAGLDHGLHLLADEQFDLQDVLARTAEANDGCLRGWISDSPYADHTSVPVQVLDRQLGTYDVDLCRLSCAVALPGEQLNATDAGQESVTVSFDLIATGKTEGSPSNVTLGAVVVGRFDGEGCGLP